MRPQRSMGLGEKYLQAQESSQNYALIPSEAWVLPAPSSKKPEEREFVVDSGAWTHMLSKKDLSSAELDTLRKSRNPTTVITATGEVQINEDVQVYVHDLDLFLTVQISLMTRLATYHWANSALPQDSSSTTPSPARLRSEKSHDQASGDRSDPPKIKKQNKWTTIKQREIDCATSRSGWRSSQRISKIQKRQHSQTLLMTQIRNVPRMWHPGSTVFIFTSQKTDIAKSASEPRLQGLLAGSELVKQYLGQNNLVTW